MVEIKAKILNVNPDTIKGYLIREEEASYNDEIDDDCKEFEDGSP
jgi:hypothetical protein